VRYPFTRALPLAADLDFVLVRDAYERATGDRWKKSDSEAYNENSLQRVPAEKIISALEAVARRIPTKINSFVQEIVTLRGSAQPRLAEEAAREDRSENPR